MGKTGSVVRVALVAAFGLMALGGTAGAAVAKKFTAKRLPTEVEAEGLMKAVRGGDKAGVENFLKKGIAPNFYMADGSCRVVSPFMEAVRANNADIVRLFLATDSSFPARRDERTLDFNCKGLVHDSDYISEVSATPLYAAVEQKNFALMKLLVENDASDVAAECSAVPSPLALALRRGDLKTADFLLSHGADAKACWEEGGDADTAIELAVMTSDPEMVSLLLTRGADPNDDRGGMPPLLYARTRGSEEIARLLVAAGAKDEQAFLRDTWLKALNAHDLRQYAACYDATFKGLKATPKGLRELEREEWIDDTKKQVNDKSLQYEIKKFRTKLEAGVYTVQFELHARSKDGIEKTGKTVRLTNIGASFRIVAEGSANAVRLAGRDRDVCLAPLNGKVCRGGLVDEQQKLVDFDGQTTPVAWYALPVDEKRVDGKLAALFADEFGRHIFLAFFEGESYSSQLRAIRETDMAGTGFMGDASLMDVVELPGDEKLKCLIACSRDLFDTDAVHQVYVQPVDGSFSPLAPCLVSLRENSRYDTRVEYAIAPRTGHMTLFLVGGPGDKKAMLLWANRTYVKEGGE